MESEDPNRTLYRIKFNPFFEEEYDNSKNECQFILYITLREAICLSLLLAGGFSFNWTFLCYSVIALAC